MYRFIAITLLFMVLIGFIIIEKNSNRIPENTIPISLNYESDIAQLISKNIEKDFNNSELIIEEIDINDDALFAIFILKQDNILYEGLACIEKIGDYYKVDEIDIAKVDLVSSFTNHSMSSLLQDGRSYQVMGGCVNDNAIKSINIEYMNNSIDVIKIGTDQRTYMNCIIGYSEYSIKQIIGLDLNNNIIYSYKFYN